MKRIVLFSLMFLVFSISQAKTTNADIGTDKPYIEAVTCEGSSKEILPYMSFYVPIKGFLDQDALADVDFIALLSTNSQFFSTKTNLLVGLLVGIKANVKNMIRNGSPIFTFIFDQGKIVFDTKTKKASMINKNEEIIIDCKFVLKN